MTNPHRPRRKIGFAILIIIGLLLGLAIKHVAIGLVLGLLFGFLASGMIDGGRDRK